MPQNGSKPDIPEEFLKPYNAASEEPAMIKLWDESGLTNPDACVAHGITS